MTRPVTLSLHPALGTAPTHPLGGITLPTTVHLRRTHEVPGGASATYTQDGELIVVLIRADLVTDEGAVVIADLCTTALRQHWRPKTQLRLIHGGGAA